MLPAVTKSSIFNQRKAFGLKKYPHADNQFVELANQFPGKPKVQEPVLPALQSVMCPPISGHPRILAEERDQHLRSIRQLKLVYGPCLNLPHSFRRNLEDVSYLLQRVDEPVIKPKP